MSNSFIFKDYQSNVKLDHHFKNGLQENKIKGEKTLQIRIKFRNSEGSAVQKCRAKTTQKWWKLAKIR